MSDDSKDKTDSSKGDGTGSDPGAQTGATTMGFGELFGHIDSRIEALLGKRRSTDAGAKGTDTGTGGENPESIRAQLQTELAKLQGEEAAKKKDADRDVTIEELKAQVTKLTEEKPEENVSKLTQIMWGKKKT